MKKCFHCGKKLKKPILVDEEDGEKIYLCSKCNKEQNKELKERINGVKGIFRIKNNK